MKIAKTILGIWYLTDILVISNIVLQPSHKSSLDIPGANGHMFITIKHLLNYNSSAALLQFTPP